MVFKKKEDGKTDSNINMKGRVPTITNGKPTNRALRERELLMLLRKFKPHVADAIVVASKILKKDDASHQNQLRAAAMILDHYRRLTLDLYGNLAVEDEIDNQQGTEVQEEPQPVFSLKVIGDE